MKKQQQKKNAGVKEKAGKLTLNKQTIKDLDPKTDNPKGGAVCNTGSGSMRCETMQQTCGCY